MGAPAPNERLDPHAWAAPPPGGLRRYVPIVTWLPAYELRWLRFDAIAGATLWGLLIPEMIAYAGLAGLPPQAGLYTLLASLAAYALFGTSRHLVVAGTSASAVLLASGVAALLRTSTTPHLDLAAGLVLIVGALFLAGGLLRLGFVAQFLSRPVTEGFVFGLAIFVTVNQLPKIFGISQGPGDTIRQFFHVLTHLGDTSPATFAVGGSALVLLFGIELFAPKLPGGLIALVFGIVASAVFDLSEHGVAVVGSIPKGLPSVSVPHLHATDVAPLVATAAGMVLVILSESLGAARNFATKYGYEVDPNQEMIALGVANIGSGFIGGLAAGGSLSQSAVNEGAGARTEVSPLFAALLAAITVIALTPIFKDLPEAVLAAVIINAVSHLWKVGDFIRYFAERRVEAILGLATLAGVITFNVLPGLVIGVVSMLLLVIYKSSRPHLSVLGEVPGLDGAFGDIGRHPEYRAIPGLLLLRLDSALFYANASLVRDQIKVLAGSADPTPRAVILDIGATIELDITSAQTFIALTRTLHRGGIDFALAEVRSHVAKTARRTGLLAALGDDRLFSTVEAAVESLRPRDAQTDD
ncbi:MAG TPA: SulP family inorganic anion transporter [Gaiellaceae bacterium]|nr:SulP family inorganic anion transporter [Gaiellaceae bacterium]